MIDARRLSKWQTMFLCCFVALLWTSVGLVLYAPSAKSLQTRTDDFYRQDDDCDGIPNFQDAQFTMRSYNACGKADGQRK